MTTDTIKITMDLLYRKYLIPMLLFDENGYLIHPKNLEDLPITISTYFPFKKTEQIQLYHTTSYLYGYFCFKSDQKEYQMIIGPCGIIGSKETSCFFMGHEYHYNIHYSKEDKYSFEEYIQLLHTILTQRPTKKEEFIWYFQQEKNKKIYPLITAWKIIFMIDGSTKKPSIRIILNYAI